MAPTQPASGKRLPLWCPINGRGEPLFVDGGVRDLCEAVAALARAGVATSAMLTEVVAKVHTKW